MSKRTKYEEKYLRANRTFPTGNTVLLVILVAAQVGLILFAVLFQPKPQDQILRYDVTAEPCPNGSLDIEYSFVWKALDASEELTWVEIGMANDNYSVKEASSNIKSFQKYSDEGYVSLQLYFHESYSAGDVVTFSFRVNQRDMLCKNEKGYFYEFVPGWFNYIQVDQYTFTWRTDSGDITHTGSLDRGQYDKLTVQYGVDDFAGCSTVKYRPFDAEGAYDGLEADKWGAVVGCCLIAALLVFLEVYIIDSYVSYSRGRGFLTGYGHHVHTYGRTNPHYIKARDKYAAKSGGRGGRSGGCACACACACAGGGRAGCSQKDTYENRQLI